MKKLIIALVFTSIFFGGFAQEVTENSEIEARVEVKVYNLKHTYLSHAYQSVIWSLVATDYNKNKSSVSYDKESNVLIVTATPIVQQKVERFLNKIDVKAEFLAFKVLILKTTEKTGFDKSIDKDIVKELQEIDVKGAKIISKAKIITTFGKKASVTNTPESGNGFEVLFTPTGSKDNLIIDLKLNKLSKSLDNAGATVYNRFSIISSAFPISTTKPVIVGMTYEDDSSAILALKLIK